VHLKLSRYFESRNRLFEHQHAARDEQSAAVYIAADCSPTFSRIEMTSSSQLRQF